MRKNLTKFSAADIKEAINVNPKKLNDVKKLVSKYFRNIKDDLKFYKN